MVALFVFAAIAAAAGAPVRPTQITLMPAIARSPGELVAANTVWSTGEGFGAFVGPFVAGVLMGLDRRPRSQPSRPSAFLVTARSSPPACGSSRQRCLRRRPRSAMGGELSGRGSSTASARSARQPVLAWSMLGTYGQVLTRGLLNAMTVVAAIELLGMGQGGTGLLGAALGLGGLVRRDLRDARRSDPSSLIRTEIVGLVFWGLPLTVDRAPAVPEVALAAMVVIGVANATYDVALFTIFQRACANEDRAPVLSVLEGVIGLGAISGSLLAPILIGIFGNPRRRWSPAALILPVIAAVIYLRIGRPADHGRRRGARPPAAAGCRVRASCR